MPVPPVMALLAVAMLACAASQPGHPGTRPDPPEPLRLALEYGLEANARPSADHLLELRSGEVYEHASVMQRLDEIMRELTSVVADSLAHSPSVKWVVTEPNPRLSPDRVVRLLFRSLTWAEGREEGTLIPRVLLDVMVLHASDDRLLHQESLWATGAELHLRRAADLDLVALYRNAALQITDLVEAL